ncbi:MAG: aldehyde dehydrogenase family protein [Planctomycetes bacterium]|nr:aldehyde dehydrogenase family protein [Planctomycetota bacterium]
MTIDSVSTYPLYVAGLPEAGEGEGVVRDKFTQQVIARVGLAGPDQIERAIAAAASAKKAMAAMPAFKRQAVLQHCVKRFEERFEFLAQVLCREAGKPLRDARGEVQRLIDTFRVAAEESVRMVGEVLPLDICERAQGYRGQWKRVPIGPVSFITPFNFPLNLVAHKVAPAIAAGCPFVLKPASLTPIGALLIAEILAETDLPPGAFSVLPCSREAAGAFTTDERLKLLSFTGSPDVGWALKARAGRKKVTLELGGNAAVLVDETADWQAAVPRILAGAFYQSGQSCIGVQRILIHHTIADPMREALVKGAQALVLGNPLEPGVDLGPMISEKEAMRVESWVEQAREGGARLLCGGQRSGSMYEATLLDQVPRDSDLYRKEVFGPVALIETFEGFDEALELIDDSEFGLQAGIFTKDIFRANKAWDELEVGAVVIGDIPSWRVDHMPYGGVKASGLGREGIRFAMEDMTEIRLMVLRMG